MANRLARSAVRTILVAALLVGIPYRVFLASQPPVVRADGTIRYHPLALNLAKGNGFTYDLEAPFRPSDHDVPGYPIYLATIYWLSGVSLHAVVFSQLALELATLWLVRLLALRLGFAADAASYSAALGFGCLFLPSIAVEWLSETLAIFMVTLFVLLLAAIIASADASYRLWAWAGLVAGLCALVRVDAYAIAFLCGCAALVTSAGTSLSRGIKQASVFAATLGITLLPWIVRDWLVLGKLQLPGTAHFTYSHVGLGFRNWLDTWVDDGPWIEMYVWGPYDRRPRSFPSQSGLPDERARAEAAFATAMQESRDPFNPQVLAEFDALARIAHERRPLETKVSVRLRRVLLTWLRVPTLTATPGIRREPLRSLSYFLWYSILGCAALGVLAALRARSKGLCVLLALIAARSLIPFTSAWGLETRYLYQAVPALLILAGVGLNDLGSSRTRFTPPNELKA